MLATTQPRQCSAGFVRSKFLPADEMPLHGEMATIEALAAEVRRLQERLEDLEDLMELRAAVERNGGKPGTPWDEVKVELDLR